MVSKTSLLCLQRRLILGRHLRQEPVLQVHTPQHKFTTTRTSPPQVDLVLQAAVRPTHSRLQTILATITLASRTARRRPVPLPPPHEVTLLTATTTKYNLQRNFLTAVTTTTLEISSSNIVTILPAVPHPRKQERWVVVPPPRPKLARWAAVLRPPPRHRLPDMHTDHCNRHRTTIILAPRRRRPKEERWAAAARWEKARLVVTAEVLTDTILGNDRLQLTFHP